LKLIGKADKYQKKIYYKELTTIKKTKNETHNAPPEFFLAWKFINLTKFTAMTRGSK